ncbi:MAG: hypothetical protein JWQ24_5551, partial [Tardiphaga sp.]|nr:hypothetical protein [Tardiphaga sp.]
PLDCPSASASTALDLILNVITVGSVSSGYLSFGDAVRFRTS